MTNNLTFNGENIGTWKNNVGKIHNNASRRHVYYAIKHAKFQLNYRHTLKINFEIVLFLVGFIID